MVKEYDDYLKFVDSALEIAKKIPKYFSKYSNHIYCNHQKLVLIVLMQKLKLTTRGLVSFLRSNPTLSMHIGLFRIPVHTTIVRFMAKVKKVINLILDLRQANSVAIDATGFELESKSYYYRIRQDDGKRFKFRKYMKLNLVIDTDNQFILKYKINKKAGRDSSTFVINLIKDLKINYIIADEGYDSKLTRKFVINKLKQFQFF